MCIILMNIIHLLLFPRNSSMTRYSYLANFFSVFHFLSELLYLKRIIEGLNKIHNEEFVHRDFHPGNILIKTSSCIADFGLTKPKDKKTSNQ